MRNILFAISIILLVSGCASKPFKYNVSGIDTSASFPVSDLRPSKEKEQEIFSLLVTSDAYAIYRNAENAIDSTPLRLFQHRVYDRFSKENSPVDVKLYHLVSYMNAQSELRKSAVAASLGSVGVFGAVASQNNKVDPSVSLVKPEAFNSLADKEYERAFYDSKENPNKATVFVIYIDAEINGKRILIRKTSPTSKTGNSNPYVDAVDSTITAFLSFYDNT